MQASNVKSQEHQEVKARRGEKWKEVMRCGELMKQGGADCADGRRTDDAHLIHLIKRSNIHPIKFKPPTLSSFSFP